MSRRGSYTKSTARSLSKDTRGTLSPRGLAKMVEALRSLPSVTAVVAARASERLSELAQESFSAQRSVYGDAYGEGSRGDAIDLRETGALEKRAVGYRSAGRRVYASVSSIKYARFLIKYGYMPRGGAKLPPVWDAEIRRIAEEELAKHFAGAA